MPDTPDPLRPGHIQGQNPNTPERMPGHTAFREGERASASRRQVATIFVLAILLGFLGLSVWFMITTWNSVEGEMGTHQWIAMLLGIVFSCVVGFGLMGLMFYSRRRGYDEPPKFDK